MEQAFAAWYRRDAARVVRAVALDTGDPELARDAAAEACTQLLTRWAEGKRPLDPTAWTVVAALRLARHHRRRLRRERELLAGSLPGIAAPGPAHLDPDLVAAVRALSPRVRHAVVLRYVADLSEDQVAAALGVRPGTASSLLAQGRARLNATLPPPEPRP